MYRPAPSPSERATTASLVLLVHIALALALLNLSGGVKLPVPDALTRLIDITAEPPPPIVTEPETEKAKKKEGAASAKNIESEATPVVAPKPVFPVPSPNPITASPTPRQGAEATQGASDVVGPGTGAGGSGTGTGSGGAGNGPGGGGNDLAVVRTRLATRPLTRRDFSPDILDRWPRGRPVNMRFRVDIEGRIIQCIVDFGTGDQQLDETVCATAKARLRFYPGLNRDGQRVADWAGYGQRPLN
ncbi:MAG: energy transducer TonB [Sphingomicrobium sp.]